MSHPVTSAPTQASDYAAGGNHQPDTDRQMMTALPGHVSDFLRGGRGGYSRQYGMWSIDVDSGTKPLIPHKTLACTHFFYICLG